MSKRLMTMTLVALVAVFGPMASAETKSTAKTKKSTSAKAEAAKEKAPRLTVVEPIKDFGTVAKGEKLDWSFVIKNTGTADLEIIAARPACGCTVAEFDKVVKPGATGKVSANVDTMNFAGPISKAITLETNDPSNPAAQLTIHAVVKPYVEAYPAGFVRYNMLQGDAETQSVILYSEEEAPFEIVKVNVPGEHVKVDYRKIENTADLAPNAGRAGQAQYKLNITVGGPDAKLGPLADKIHIITNSKHQPDYFVSVTGVIRPTFRVEPSGVNFGEVAPTDTAATRSVILRSGNLKAPETFVVTKAESSVPGVTAAVKPGNAKGEFDVTVQVSKDAKPGDLDGKITIHTNDKIRPTVEVPVKGTVKAATPTASK